MRTDWLSRILSISAISFSGLTFYYLNLREVDDLRMSFQGGVRVQLNTWTDAVVVDPPEAIYLSNNGTRPITLADIRYKILFSCRDFAGVVPAEIPIDGTFAATKMLIEAGKMYVESPTPGTVRPAQLGKCPSGWDLKNLKLILTSINVAGSTSSKNFTLIDRHLVLLDLPYETVVNFELTHPLVVYHARYPL